MELTQEFIAYYIDKAQTEIGELNKTKIFQIAQIEFMLKQLETLRAETETMKNEHEALNTRYEDLQAEYGQLHTDYIDLVEKSEKLTARGGIITDPPICFDGVPSIDLHEFDRSALPFDLEGIAVNSHLIDLPQKE